MARKVYCQEGIRVLHFQGPKYYIEKHHPGGWTASVALASPPLRCEGRHFPIYSVTVERLVLRGLPRLYRPLRPDNGMIVRVQGNEPINDQCGNSNSLPCQPYHVLTYRVERLGYIPRRTVYPCLVF